jgi:hypothetical protein
MCVREREKEVVAVVLFKMIIMHYAILTRGQVGTRKINFINFINLRSVLENKHGTGSTQPREYN